MRRSADPVLELARLVRHPDQQCHNIGLHLRQHADMLGPALGLEQELLQAMSDQPDHLLAGKLEPRLHALKEQLAREQAAADNSRAHEAARELASRARWDCTAVCVEPAVLLGELLADQGMKYIQFELSDRSIAVERRTLVATARVLGRRTDVSASVDGAGLHFRWHSGHGGLNWHPQLVPQSDRHRVLSVRLHRPEPAPMPARLRRPAWSWDAFAELPLSP